MSTTIQILTERLYDFSNLSAAATSDVVIVKALDVVAYRSGELQVRVHQADYGSNTPTLKLIAYVTAPSSDEPSADFVGGAKATATLKDGSTSTSAGDVVVEALTPEFGGYLRVVLEAVQASPADTLQATLSAQVVLNEEP